MTGFNPRTDIPEFPHQTEQAPLIRPLPVAAMFWKVGTGKTRTDLEDTAWQYYQGKIDAVLVVAPGEVHRKVWVEKQAPVWWHGQPVTIGKQSYGATAPLMPGALLHAYAAKNNLTAQEYRDQEAYLERPGFKLLSVYFEAFNGKTGLDYILRFCRQFAGRLKVTIDESHRIMTPGSIASIKLATKIRELTNVRRIMTATPTAQGLQDLYGQFRALDPTILDASTYAEYKAMYVHERKVPGTHFSVVTGYKNVAYLNKRIAPYVFVAAKPAGLPPQFWNDVYVEMSEEQWTAYRELKKDYLTQLSNGHWVEAELSIVRMKRLQQIVAGHVTVADPENERRTKQVFELPCPRVETCIDVVRGCPDKVLVWAQEHYEIERLHRELNKAGVPTLMYYGKLSKKGGARDDVLDRFEDDASVKALVANDAIGGTGLTIVGRAAPVSDSVFYSHTWSRILREQCEGRPHRPGTTASSMTYHDLMAPRTTDTTIRNRVKTKDDIAQLIADPKALVALLAAEGLDYEVYTKEETAQAMGI